MLLCATRSKTPGLGLASRLVVDLVGDVAAMDEHASKASPRKTGVIILGAGEDVLPCGVTNTTGWQLCHNGILLLSMGLTDQRQARLAACKVRMSHGIQFNLKRSCAQQ